jgi:hypothetical protein
VIKCDWIGGASGPAVGARFRAKNKRRWFAWSNQPIVETAGPGHEFAISRTERGGGTIRWGYTLEPHQGGTMVTESYEVVKAVPMGLLWILRLLFGVRDLEADLNTNMQTSLGLIARIAQHESTERSTDPAQ